MLHVLFPSRALCLAMLLSACIFLAAGGWAGGGVGHAQTVTSGTPANSDPKTIDANGNSVRCNDIPEARGGVFIGKIIPCLTRTVEYTAQRFSLRMIIWLRPLLYAFLTFVIVMFGLKMLQGEGQLQTHAIVLLIKIGFVLSVLDMIPNTLIPASYGIMAETQQVVMSTIGPQTQSLHCEVAQYQGAQTPLIWAQVDCILGKLYGFTVGRDTAGVSRPNMLLASSVLGLLGGFFFGGTFGVALFFMAVGVLWSMFTLVLRVIVAFLNAHMILALYMIIAPLFLPLIFLRVTTQYVEKWWAGVIAALLMPMVICAYMVVGLQLYDKMLFAPDSLVQGLFNNELIKQAQSLPRQALDMTIASDPTKFREEISGKSADDIMQSPFLKNMLNDWLGGANNLGGAVSRHPALDFTNVDDPRYKDNVSAFKKLFRDFLKLLVLAWLVDAGFKTLTAAIRPVLGSGAVVASLDTYSTIETRLQSGIRSAQRGFSQTLSYDEKGNELSGTDFIRSIPKALQNAIGDPTNPRGGGFLVGITQG